MKHTLEEMTARARNRAVTAFVFVSQAREEIDPSVLENDGFLMSSSSEQSDPSRVVFPLQFDDSVKNAAKLIPIEKAREALEELNTRQDKLHALKSVGSGIVDDLVEPFTFGEDVMRQLNGIPQKFSVGFTTRTPIEDQIDAEIPFIKLDRDLREISSAAGSVGGFLQGVKVIHTSMSQMADDVRESFGIGFRLSWPQRIERRIDRGIQDLTGWRPPTLLN